MQTLMELIETCINKESNANPSDVSPNVSPNVFTIEAITKAPIFAATLDVREENDSHPVEVKGKQLCGIAKSESIKKSGGIMFTVRQGDHHYFLLEALPIYAQEDPHMIKLLCQ
jgi:hypothetical protein